MKNINEQTALKISSKKKEPAHCMYSMGAQIKDSAYIKSRRERKSVYKIARMKGNVILANKVDENICGRKEENGKQVVWSLRAVMTVREQVPMGPI